MGPWGHNSTHTPKPIGCLTFDLALPAGLGSLRRGLPLSKLEHLSPCPSWFCALLSSLLSPFIFAYFKHLTHQVSPHSPQYTGAKLRHRAGRAWELDLHEPRNQPLLPDSSTCCPLDHGRGAGIKATSMFSGLLSLNLAGVWVQRQGQC